MFDRFRKLFGGQDETGATPAAAAAPARSADPSADFARLNELAPLKSGAADVPAQARSFVCREAILDRGERVAGYEFALTQRLQSRLKEKSDLLHRVYDEALLRNVALLDIPRLLAGRLAFVHLHRGSLDNPLIDRLPAGSTVLMLVAGESADFGAEALAAALARQRARGLRYGWLLRSPPERPGPLLADADFVQIEAPAFDGLQIRSALRELQAARSAGLPRLRLVARDLQAHEDFDLCFRAGFDYFQGPFVTSREHWQAPKSDIDRLRLITLLNLVRQGAEFDVIAENMRLEPVLTFKLLRYLNSPLLALQQKITAAPQALMILGRDKFYRWLSLLLFNVRDPGYRERILTEQALTRGRLLENLSGRGGVPDAGNDLFLLGLFSLLDVLLGQPMPEIVGRALLPEAVRAALLGTPGPWRDALELALAYEAGDEGRLVEATARCGLDAGAVTDAALEALGWAAEIGAAQDDA